MRARARRGQQLQRWLAASLVTLLTFAPFAQSSRTFDFFAVAAASVASDVVVDDGIAQASTPEAGLRPAPPVALGILTRPSSLETALGLLPVKSPLFRLDAGDELLLAPPATKAFGVGIARIFHRSAVGTARTPTGPPS